MGCARRKRFYGAGETPYQNDPEQRRRYWNEEAEKWQALAHQQNVLPGQIEPPAGFPPYNGMDKEAYVDERVKAARWWLESDLPGVSNPLSCLSDRQREEIAESVRKVAQRYCRKVERALQGKAERKKPRPQFERHLDWTVGRIIERKAWTDFVPRRKYRSESRNRELTRIKKAVAEMLKLLGLPAGRQTAFSPDKADRENQLQAAKNRKNSGFRLIFGVVKSPALRLPEFFRFRLNREETHKICKS
ncbi:MAG TPA: hypothetical protein VNQ79_21440 [Blastocatellia bacterium]|nr:hypothetical protein [Blastocatellia bacterium]